MSLRGLEGLDVIEAVGDAAAEFQEGRALAEPAPPLQRARADLPAAREFVLAQHVRPRRCAELRGGGHAASLRATAVRFVRRGRTTTW
jgi:hypothetical protein